LSPACKKIQILTKVKENYRTLNKLASFTLCAVQCMRTHFILNNFFSVGFHCGGTRTPRTPLAYAHGEGAHNASVVWQVPFKNMEALFGMQCPRHYRVRGIATDARDTVVDNVAGKKCMSIVGDIAADSSVFIQ
jgi:hypothetical protein